MRQALLQGGAALKCYKIEQVSQSEASAITKHDNYDKVGQYILHYTLIAKFTFTLTEFGNRQV